MSRTIQPSIRKVAALLASVDRATAERLLAKLPPEKAREALAAARKLGELPEHERQAAIEEFRREAGKSANRAPRAEDATGDPEIELSLSPQAKRLSETTAPPSPFRFLDEACDEELHACLAGENAQVIAVALSHLSAARGGRLLQELDEGARTAAMERFASLDDSDVELARQGESEIAAHLCERLAGMRKKNRRLDRLREILSAAGLAEKAVLPVPAVGDRARPAPQAAPLAEETDAERDLLPAFDDLPPEELSRQFSRLFALPSGSLALVCSRAALGSLLDAIAGAEPDDAETFLRMLPKAESQSFRERLADVFPLSLARIERAQGELLALAGDLADEGLI